MDSEYYLSLSLEEQNALPLIPLLICGKVQSEFLAKQIKILLQALQAFSIDNQTALWVYDELHHSLCKHDLDLFMVLMDKMEHNINEKHRIVAWTIRFVKAGNADLTLIQNSVSLLMQIIKLWLTKAQAIKWQQYLTKYLADSSPSSIKAQRQALLNDLQESSALTKTYPSCGWLSDEVLSHFNVTLRENKNHSEPEKFIQLLRGSISLAMDEKKRVITSYPRLSIEQINELYQIFENEKIKFINLYGSFPEDVRKLEFQRAQEWIQLSMNR